MPRDRDTFPMLTGPPPRNFPARSRLRVFWTA
jgi:hypothetical protein